MIPHILSGVIDLVLLGVAIFCARIIIPDLRNWRHWNDEDAEISES